LAPSVPPSSIVHCGGSSAVAYSYAHPLSDFQRAVDTTAVALDWMRSAGAPHCRLVLVSSAAIYGDQGDVDLSETMAQTPISPYGFHKSVAETLCNSYSRFFAQNVSVVRLFSVYGNGLRKQLLWDAANKFKRGESKFFGTGHELRDWIHVTDAAALLCAAATTPQSRYEIFNGGHTQLTTSEILTRLAACLDGSPTPVFTGETHSGNPRRLTSDSNHARRQLDWAPAVDIDAGLRGYAEWFQQACGP
jgi:UDP-glucose 4-epimerase